MTSESVHYRFEQVAEGAWAAVAIDSGAGVGNMGIADLGGRALVVDCGYTPLQRATCARPRRRSSGRSSAW